MYVIRSGNYGWQIQLGLRSVSYLSYVVICFDDEIIKKKF